MDADLPTSIVTALEACADEHRRGFTFQDYDGNEQTWTFSRVRDEAIRHAAHLRSQGIGEGDRVILVLPDAVDFIPAVLGAMWLGAVPVPMYPPLSLGKVPAYQETLRNVAAKAQPTAVLTVEWLRAVVEPVVGEFGAKTVVYQDEPGAAQAQRVEPAPGDVAFLQFTSGSTAEPKGVMVTHGSLRANAKAIMVDGLRVDSERDRGVSWLPLYHDMGLIGFVLAPVFTRSSVTFIPTLGFLKNPAVWLDTLHRTKATVTSAPNFAYSLVAKKATEEQKASWDLSAVRAFGCGAEPINPAVMRSFVEAFAAAGVRSTQLLPCYGMAEATLAMTFTDPADEFTVDGNFVGCGRALPGHRIAVVGERGEFLPNREIGELVFSGPSVTGGYFENPEATRQAFQGEWLHTGDLGYLVDGEVFVTGRKKDLIVVNGRNHDPQRIEWLVDGIPGIRRGNVAAFSVPGEDSEKLVIAFESKQPAAELVPAIRRVVQAAAQLAVSDVIRLEPGRLPKTSSGKLQRRRARQLYLEGQLSDAVIATRAV